MSQTDTQRPHGPARRADPFNEGRVCDVIVGHLEGRVGIVRTNVRSPETEHHRHPIDLAWTLGPALYALEHTGIEPFDGHVQLNAESQHHYDPIVETLRDELPEGVFNLQVPLNAMRGKNRSDAAKIQAGIVSWIREVAPAIPLTRYREHRDHRVTDTPPDVPFQVALTRLRPNNERRGFFITHLISHNHEEARVQRLRRMCEKKFPKLAAWKADYGARTILVLEENDIQLTNHILVAEALLPIVAETTNRPDEIYLVSTDTEEWSAWPMIVDNVTMLDMLDDDKDPIWEIDASTLVDLTSR